MNLKNYHTIVGKDRDYIREIKSKLWVFFMAERLEFTRYNTSMDAEKRLLKAIASQLKANNLFLATAESCTGGLLSHLITNLPGSSDYYLGGQIAYSNQAKRLWLKVPAEVLDTFGAVSRETVLVMAYGIRTAFAGEVDLQKIVGFSISGIAGPGGSTSAKPVGTVWMAISTHVREHAYHFHFYGSRDAIKYQSALQALNILSTDISVV
jgi:PncC family amidohydrolase